VDDPHHDQFLRVDAEPLGDPRLDQLQPHLEPRARRAPEPGRELGEGAGLRRLTLVPQRVAQQVVGQAGGPHDRAAPAVGVPGVDQSLLLQFAQPAANGDPADPETFLQLGDGRQ
jgi:hypothetical protein